jgi:hypothetical protein
MNLTEFVDSGFRCSTPGPALQGVFFRVDSHVRCITGTSRALLLIRMEA